MFGQAVRLSETPLRAERAAPAFGQDSRDVLRELTDLDEPAIERLIEDGTVEVMERGDVVFERPYLHWIRKVQRLLPWGAVGRVCRAVNSPVRRKHPGQSAAWPAHPTKPGAGRRRTIRGARAIEEARCSGNTELDVTADWLDYEQAGVTDAAGLDRRIIEVLTLVGLDGDVYLFGLHGRLDPERHSDAADRLLEARQRFGERADALDLARFIERFDPERYNTNASIADNLLFGTPIGPVFDGDGLAENPYVQKVLHEAGLNGDLLEVGRKLADMMVELFGDTATGHGLAEEFGFVRGEELRDFERILARTERGGPDSLPARDRARLLGSRLQTGGGARPARR